MACPPTHHHHHRRRQPAGSCARSSSPWPRGTTWSRTRPSRCCRRSTSTCWRTTTRASARRPSRTSWCVLSLRVALFKVHPFLLCVLGAPPTDKHELFSLHTCTQRLNGELPQFFRDTPLTSTKGKTKGGKHVSSKDYKCVRACVRACVCNTPQAPPVPTPAHPTPPHPITRPTKGPRSGTWATRR